MARLGDVCTVVSGTTPNTNNPKFWDGDINWITPAELDESTIVISESKRKITIEGVRSCGLSPFPAGTVILSSRAPIGKTAIAGTEMYCNQGFKNLICTDRIFNKYLFWFLRCKTRYLNSLGRGATFKEISKAIVEQIEIPLPDLPTQRRVAATLDKVSEGIALCKQMLADLDELVKSQFVEMFGDPVKNPMRWPSKPAKQLMTKIGSGATPKGGNSAYIDEGISLIRSMHVYNGCFDYDDLAHINEEQAHALDGVTVENNDVLLNITGASVARCCIVPDDILPARVNQHVCILRCRQNTILPVFVNAMLISDSYQDLLWQYAESAGATRQALTKQQIENLQIILPPIELQKQYERFKNQADKSKIAVQQQLAELETLKKSLMQEYFG